MNLKKLTSLALASLMGLNVFTVMPRISAQGIPSESVSESEDIEKEKDKLVEEIKKEIEKDEDSKKEAVELKKELSECNGKNKSSKLKLVTLKILKFIGKFIGGAVLSAIAAGAFVHTRVGFDVARSIFHAGCGFCAMVAFTECGGLLGGILTAILL